MPYKDKTKQKEYQKNYWKDKPKSARMTKEYYDWYKFLTTLNIEELQVLFFKRKHECKYAMKEQIQQLRTEMAIITDVLEKLQKELVNEQ